MSNKLKLNSNFIFYFEIKSNCFGLLSWTAEGQLDTQTTCILKSRKQFKTTRRIVENIKRFCELENIDFAIR